MLYLMEGGGLVSCLFVGACDTVGNLCTYKWAFPSCAITPPPTPSLKADRVRGESNQIRT